MNMTGKTILLESALTDSPNLTAYDYVLTIGSGRPARLVEPSRVDLERCYEVVGFNASSQLHGLRDGSQWRVATVSEVEPGTPSALTVEALEYEARVLGVNAGTTDGVMKFVDDRAVFIEVDGALDSSRIAIRVVEYFGIDEHGNLDLVAERFAGVVGVSEERGR